MCGQAKVPRIFFVLLFFFFFSLCFCPISESNGKMPQEDSLSLNSPPTPVVPSRRSLLGVNLHVESYRASLSCFQLLLPRENQLETPHLVNLVSVLSPLFGDFPSLNSHFCLGEALGFSGICRLRFCSGSCRY